MTRHVVIKSPMRDLREDVVALIGIEIHNKRVLPIACGAWQRERADARHEVLESVLRLIDRHLKKEER